MHGREGPATRGIEGLDRGPGGGAQAGGPGDWLRAQNVNVWECVKEGTLHDVIDPPQCRIHWFSLVESDTEFVNFSQSYLLWSVNAVTGFL